MKLKGLTKTILRLALGLSACAFTGFGGVNAFAADTDDITTTSTKSQIQEIVDEGNFDYRELSKDEVEHIYSLYDYDPETIKQLQKQSDYNAAKDVATLSATSYTHSSMFKGYTVVKGIDVSEWNGTINWTKVKASGISYAFIRVGGRYYGSGKYYEDSMYKQNIKGAIAAGLDVGVYFYSQATSTAQAKKEAAFTLDLISGYNITLPVVMDYEYAYEDGIGLTGILYDAHLSKNGAATVINAFCQAVEEKGYVGMLYASKSVLVDDINMTNVDNKYPVWLAQYNDADTYTRTHSYWQYSDAGTVPGISYPTDMNFRYIKAPIAPELVLQSASTDSTITLTWTKVPEVYGYQVVRYDAAQDKYVSVGTSIGAGTNTFTDKGLLDGQKYKYKVRGYYKLKSGTKFGAYSPECEGITIADLVENFKGVAKGSDTISLSWSTLPAATGYRIYRSDGSGGYQIAKTLKASDISSFTDTGLKGGHTYLYKIRAYSITQSGTIWHVLSDPISVTTGPGQVTGLKVTGTTSSSISLKWDAQVNVQGYTIYLWDSDSAVWKRIAKNTDKTNNTYTYSKLPSLTKYTFAVAAYYAKNNSYAFTDFSQAVSCFTGPGAVSGFTVSGKSYDAIRLSWKKKSGVSGYLVYQYIPASKGYKLIKKIESPSTTYYKVTGLSAGTGYSFAIKAYVTSDGANGYGDVAKLHTCTWVNAPNTSLTYTELGGYRYTKWKAVSGANGYIVYKYDKKANKYTQVKKLAGEKNTSYLSPALAADKYTYRVKAYVTYKGKTFYSTISKMPPKSTEKLLGMVNSAYINVRKGPGTSYNIITQVSTGRKVYVLGGTKAYGETWYKVTFTKNNKAITGYIHSDYIDIL